MIQARLETYRRKKQIEEMTDSINSSLKTILPWKPDDQSKEEVKKMLIKEVNEETESNCSDDSMDESESSILKKVLYVLYFILWVTFYVIAIKYQFGSVYFAITTLLFICLNTRSKPKKAGEPSAYSVFNPGCESIQGTFSATEIERQLRYGPMRL